MPCAHHEERTKGGGWIRTSGLCPAPLSAPPTDYIGILL